MVAVFLLFFSVLLGSALCSMAEAAILSLSTVRVKVLKEHNKPNADDLLFIKEHISDTIATIVILNNAINIVGSIFIGQKVSFFWGNQWLGLASAVVTFLIIILGEIIPKTIGERYRSIVGLWMAKPVRWLVWFFYPVVSFMLKISKAVLPGKYKRGPKVTEDEIRMMLKLGRAEGTVEMDEEVLCNRVFKLNDIRAAQIMKPIDGIYAIEASKTLAEVKDMVIHSRYSRIAVFDKDPHDFVGVVQQRVLLREMAKDNDKAHVRDFMQAPIFVSWFMKADTLLEKFQMTNQHFLLFRTLEGKTWG